MLTMIYSKQCIKHNIIMMRNSIHLLNKESKPFSKNKLFCIIINYITENTTP